MKLSLALEWFLNPDHLPFIAGIQMGKYKQEGLDVVLIEPKEHYDGFKDLHDGKIDIHINEPLHLFEHHFEGIKSLGCFFETNGGVMVKASRLHNLKNNEDFVITTPASNETTNTIGFEILNRYAKKEGFTLNKKNIKFIQTDFYHLKNLKKIQFDAAWLCFYNFEAIEAQYEDFNHIFIDHTLSPYPNFSALELMTTQKIISEKKEALKSFIKVTEYMIEFCKAYPEKARELYYEYSNTSRSELTNRIIENTLTRFEESIKSDAKRWKDVYNFLHELNLVHLTNNEYDNIFDIKELL
ncbi:MAG: ABC transporter substrate-binding protein [Arcobacteraceae bacterium]